MGHKIINSMFDRYRIYCKPLNMFGSSPSIGYLIWMSIIYYFLRKAHLISKIVTFFFLFVHGYGNYFHISNHTLKCCSSSSVSDEICNWRFTDIICGWVNVKIALVYYISVFHRTCMVPIEHYWNMCAFWLITMNAWFYKLK